MSDSSYSQNKPYCSQFDCIRRINQIRAINWHFFKAQNYDLKPYQLMEWTILLVVSPKRSSVSRQIGTVSVLTFQATVIRTFRKIKLQPMISYLDHWSLLSMLQSGMSFIQSDIRSVVWSGFFKILLIVRVKTVKMLS